MYSISQRNPITPKHFRVKMGKAFPDREWEKHSQVKEMGKHFDPKMGKAFADQNGGSNSGSKVDRTLPDQNGERNFGSEMGKHFGT